MATVLHNSEHPAAGQNPLESLTSPFRILIAPLRAFCQVLLHATDEGSASALTLSYGACSA